MDACLFCKLLMGKVQFLPAFSDQLVETSLGGFSHALTPFLTLAPKQAFGLLLGVWD